MSNMDIKDIEAEVAGIKRELRAIWLLLLAALAGVGLLVVRAYC